MLSAIDPLVIVACFPFNWVCTLLVGSKKAIVALLMPSNVFPVACLTEVFRQAATSQIITNAHRINKGLMPLTTPFEVDSDFYFLECESPEDCCAQIITLVREHIPQRFNLHPLYDIQVLSPMNRGGLGAKTLTAELQSVLNPSPSRISRFDWRYGMGDKVMQITNDYDKEVYNGDIGFITALNLEEETLMIRFDGRSVEYNLSDLDQVVPAYAITIHKSQGSEYPAVVIPLTMQHYPLLRKNLIYTGITRGQKLVILVGQKKALEIALQKNKNEPRWSKLKEWLME